MPVGRAVRAGRPESAAGQRDRHVLIQAPVDPPAQFEQWTTLGMAWMSRRDLSADERFSSDQETAFGQARWHMAYQEDMDPELVDVPATRRLVYEGRSYDIIAASPMGWKRDIELITLARVG